MKVEVVPFFHLEQNKGNSAIYFYPVPRDGGGWKSCPEEHGLRLPAPEAWAAEKNLLSVFFFGGGVPPNRFPYFRVD